MIEDHKDETGFAIYTKDLGNDNMRLVGEICETVHETTQTPAADQEESNKKTNCPDVNKVLTRKFAVGVSDIIENPIVLAVSKHLSCKSRYDELVAEYCNLGSVNILVGYSAVTGFCQLVKTSQIKNNIPRYCKNFYEQDGYLPMGVHEVLPNKEDHFGGCSFKFPETAQILSAYNDRWITGPASCLGRDWYINGMRVHHINADDPHEIILRAPIRTDIDARAITLAIGFWLGSRMFSRDVLSKLEVLLKSMEMKLNAVAEKVRSECHYPPNLAELWRREADLKHGLNPVIEAYAANHVPVPVSSPIAKSALHHCKRDPFQGTPIVTDRFIS